MITWQQADTRMERIAVSNLNSHLVDTAVIKLQIKNYMPVINAPPARNGLCDTLGGRGKPPTAYPCGLAPLKGGSRLPARLLGVAPRPVGVEALPLGLGARSGVMARPAGLGALFS